MTVLSAPTTLAGEVWSASMHDGAARALLLDVDGTLAPIAPSPDRARVPATTLRALERLIDAGWKIAIVSGRTAAGARRMVPIGRVAIFGSHGIEGPHGVLLQPDVADVAAGRLPALARRALRLTAPFPRVLVESKRFGLAFHDRALSTEACQLWRRSLAEWLREEDLHGLEIVSGRRVVEIRPVGARKSTVLDSWEPARSAGAGDGSLVAAGDDETDEDLFEALGDRGLSVHVGLTGRSTRARRRVATPAAFAAFLSWLAALEENGRP